MLRELREKVRDVGAVETFRRLLYYRPFAVFERLGLHVLPVHHQSPIPDTRDLRSRFEEWTKPSSLVGVDMNLEGQVRLLSTLLERAGELTALPSHEDVRASGLGEGFGPIEAQLLYLMVRELKPRTVVEVGAGVSSYFSLRALGVNDRETGDRGRLIAIEPYPRKKLGDLSMELIRKPVEHVDLDVFTQLQENDILFIDSSHMVRLGGDVPYLYLEVLPRLRPGVYVHIHDIPLPYAMQDPDEWIFRKHRFWNENFLVHAFLLFNSAFQVALCSSYLHAHDPALLEPVTRMGERDPIPSSLWLRRMSSTGNGG